MKTEFIAYAIQNKENKKFLDNLDFKYEVDLPEAAIFHHEEDAIDNLKNIEYPAYLYEVVRVKIIMESEESNDIK